MILESLGQERQFFLYRVPNRNSRDCPIPFVLFLPPPVWSRHVSPFFFPLLPLLLFPPETQLLHYSSFSPTTSHTSSRRKVARTMLTWIETTEEPPKGSRRWRHVVVRRCEQHELKREDSLCRHPITDIGNEDLFQTSHNLLSIFVPRLSSFIVRKFGTNTRENESLNAVSNQMGLNLEVIILDL